VEIAEIRMKRQAEIWSCGDQDVRTGRKLEVPETGMKGQTER
jgi:hypothetical protein